MFHDFVLRIYQKLINLMNCKLIIYRRLCKMIFKLWWKHNEPCRSIQIHIERPRIAWQDLLTNRSQMWLPCIHWRWKHWSLSSKVRGSALLSIIFTKDLGEAFFNPKKCACPSMFNFSSPKNLSIHWRSMHPFPHPSFFPNQKWHKSKTPRSAPHVEHRPWAAVEVSTSSGFNVSTNQI